MTDDAEVRAVVLQPWTGPWEPDDPNANYKAEIALYAGADPLPTLEAMGEAMGIPVGAIIRYVLARYVSSGSGAILEIGPSMIEQLWQPIDRAETADSAEARMAAYDQLRQMVSWLRLPLIEDAGY